MAAWRMLSFLSNCLAEGLSLGAFVQHLLIISCSIGGHRSSFPFNGGRRFRSAERKMDKLQNKTKYQFTSRECTLTKGKEIVNSAQ